MNFNCGKPSNCSRTIRITSGENYMYHQKLLENFFFLELKKKKKKISISCDFRVIKKLTEGIEPTPFSIQRIENVHHNTWSVAKHEMLYMLPCMHILGLYRIPNFCNFPYSALKHHLHNTKSYFEQGLTKGINLRNTYASIFRAFHLSWKVLLYLFCLLGLSISMERPIDIVLFIIRSFHFHGKAYWYCSVYYYYYYYYYFLSAKKKIYAVTRIEKLWRPL